MIKYFWRVITVLEIRTEYREGILFVRLEGILVSNTVEFFQKELARWKEEGISNIVFNVMNLEKIDTVGIRSFFDSYQMIHDKDGRGLICGMNHHINQSLKSSRILNYIYEISDELNAIKVMKWSNQS